MKMQNVWNKSDVKLKYRCIYMTVLTRRLTFISSHLHWCRNIICFFLSFLFVKLHGIVEFCFFLTHLHIYLIKH